MTSEYTGTSAAAIQEHYDRGADFYRLWLDESMTYSAGIWEGLDPALEDALSASQVAKIEHHIAVSRASGAARVLDVGCGWGSTLARLVEHHGVGQAVGLTLSEDQHRVVGERGLAHAEVRLEGWADHKPEAPYDAAISIGAFEHFARVDHSPAERVQAYRQFYKRMRTMLKPGARLSLQSIVYGTLHELDPFIKDKIWPESELPRLSELVAGADGIFEIERLWNDRMDYAHTCSRWADNLERRRAEVTGLIGETGYADYLRYLRMSAKAFEVGALGLVRVQMVRID